MVAKCDIRKRVHKSDIESPNVFCIICDQACQRRLITQKFIYPITFLVKSVVALVIREAAGTRKLAYTLIPLHCAHPSTKGLPTHLFRRTSLGWRSLFASRSLITPLSSLYNGTVSFVDIFPQVHHLLQW